MRKTICYGQDEIEYVIAQKPDLSSKIRIHVHPNGLVEVDAPSGRTPAEISAAVRKRARWIVQQLHAARSARAYALPREYISGETHFYLGRRYQLKIIETRTESAAVAMKGGHIHVALRCADKAAVRRRLQTWYRERAEVYFSRRLTEIAASIPWIESVPPMKLATMCKQWGSCSPSGAISLNPWLIRAPRDCIDYVITHEICHLREHNHSKKYYELLERHMPEWRQIKLRLDGMAELLLAT